MPLTNATLRRTRRSSVHELAASGVTLLLLTVGSPASAQSPVPADAPVLSPRVTVGAITSIQPRLHGGPDGPYLDHSLGGAVPGVAAGVKLVAKWRALVAAELSTTVPLKVMQSGRYVKGLGPVLARHRDTLLSLLVGAQLPVGIGALEPCAGISVVFGSPIQGEVRYENAAGDVAFTTGADAVFPVGRRGAIIASLRYSIVARGDDARYVGLDRYIVRIGAGYALQLGAK